MTNSAQIATYKGRKYRLAWSGTTKFGERAKLQFWDGSKEFWVPLEAVSISQSQPRRSRYDDGLRDAYRHGWDGRIGSASYYSSGAFDELDQ